MEISFNQAFEQARKFEASLVYVEEGGEVVTNLLGLSFPFPCQNMLYRHVPLNIPFKCLDKIKIVGNKKGLILFGS